MNTKKIDYLKFNSESIKKLIIRKLSENQYFTDQVFDDSNLAILIDCFAAMFETSMFYLNNSAAESLFSDTQLYENMNRMVKLFGYNPVGFSTSVLQGNFYSDVVLLKEGNIPVNTIFIPKYSYAQVSGKKDDLGNDIYYSLIGDIQLVADQTGIFQKVKAATDTNQIIMYNGRWTKYERDFAAQGIPYESFTLNVPDEANNVFVAHPHIHIYVLRGGEYYQFLPISQGTLFGSGSTNIYGPTDNVFELRLNEYKNYTLTFGDGVHGTSLEPNDIIYIFYLKSNNITSNIAVGQIADFTIKYGVDGVVLNDLKTIVAGSVDNFNQSYYESESNYYLTPIKAENISPSTISSSAEDVEAIRLNAPQWFKQGGRLINENDFKTYIKSTYNSLIYDCNVMNAWSYAVSFQKWLLQYGLLNENIRKDYYIYADACDFNNVYIWTKFKMTLNNYNFIDKDLQSKKCLTCEPIIVETLDLILTPCLSIEDSNGVEYGMSGFDYSKLGIDSNTFDSTENPSNFIEVLRSKNSLIPHEKIKQNIIRTIKEFLSPENCYIGMTLDLSKLYNQLLNIDGVQSIRTGYLKYGDSPSNVKYYNGLSFASWSGKITLGRDFEVVKGAITVQPFQFPVLSIDSISNLEKRVRIVSETTSSNSIIEF